jgi:hypothetical protein
MTISVIGILDPMITKTGQLVFEASLVVIFEADKILSLLFWRKTSNGLHLRSVALGRAWTLLEQKKSRNQIYAQLAASGDGGV